MSKPIDLSKDWLARAALSPDERQAWDGVRDELGTARDKIADLEARVRMLERQPVEEAHAILSRPEFNREVARMLAFDERYGGLSSVLYIDCDGLEESGIKHGKAVANAAARQISDILLKHVRTSDVVGRLAPDEFGVMLMRCENSFAWKKGEQLAGLLFDALGEVHGNKLDIKISYGAYTFKGDEDVATGLKEAASAVTKANKSL